MKHVFYYQTNIGEFAIIENGTAITNVYLNKEHYLAGANEEETPLLKEAGRQLSEYLAQKRRTFKLPLAPQGTKFQQAVWRALGEIPYGETRSYGEIAKSIESPKAARAVGMANNKNPIMIFIPCHRVIGANGKLVGYACGLAVKEHLLSLEKCNTVGMIRRETK